MEKPAEQFPALATRRLRLRRIEPRDAIGLHAGFGDHAVMRFWNLPASQTLAVTEKSLERFAETTSLYSHMAWAIAAAVNDPCIGIVDYHYREAWNKCLELGCIIAPKHRRKGFATEAVQALLDYCCDELGDTYRSSLLSGISSSPAALRARFIRSSVSTRQ